MTRLATTEAALMRALPHDKCLHVIAGMLVFGVAHLAGWQIGMIAVIAVGITKEIVDHFTGGDVSAWDLAATIAGGLSGLLCFMR